MVQLAQYTRTQLQIMMQRFRNENFHPARNEAPFWISTIQENSPFHLVVGDRDSTQRMDVRWCHRLTQAVTYQINTFIHHSHHHHHNGASLAAASLVSLSGPKRGRALSKQSTQHGNRGGVVLASSLACRAMLIGLLGARKICEPSARQVERLRLRKGASGGRTRISGSILSMAKKNVFKWKGVS